MDRPQTTVSDFDFNVRLEGFKRAIEWMEANREHLQGLFLNLRSAPNRKIQVALGFLSKNDKCQQQLRQLFGGQSAEKSNEPFAGFETYRVENSELGLQFTWNIWLDTSEQHPLSETVII